MIRRTIATVALLLGGVGPLAAQNGDTNDPKAFYTTRAELEALLEWYEAAAGNDTLGDEARNRAQDAVALIRDRLEEGDFRVGDRVAITVEEEPALTDTFTVSGGQVLEFPVIGSVPLQGVLRSELEIHLRRELSRYIQDPVVYARSLIRITVDGEISQPGYYELPAEARIEDVLMAAGGPSGDARLDWIRVERDGERIWDDEALRRVMVEGWTLDQLNLRAGDRIHVPKNGIFNVGSTGRLLLLTVPGLILGAIRIF